MNLKQVRVVICADLPVPSLLDNVKSTNSHDTDSWKTRYLGDKCIQNFHLGRYIVRYTVGNLVLRRHSVISDRISDDIPSQMKILNMVIPILLHFCNFVSNWKPNNAAPYPTKCDAINDVKMFPTVYRRICSHKFLTLSNQTSCYKSKCIRIHFAYPPLDGYHQKVSEYDQKIPQSLCRPTHGIIRKSQRTLTVTRHQEDYINLI